MILVIDGKKYPAATISDLSLRHTLELQRELTTENISRAKTWGEVRGLVEEFAALPDDAARSNHPESLFLMAVTIWATRVTAGEALTLLESVDIPATSVKWVAEPTDRQEAAEGAGGKAPARAKPAGAAKPKK